METKESQKKRTKKTKSELAVSFDEFSLKEQAMITLGADNKNQAIPEFMAESIRYFIKEMVEVRFKPNQSQVDEH